MHKKELLGVPSPVTLSQPALVCCVDGYGLLANILVAPTQSSSPL
jgi:hypothetical protein